MCGGAGSRLNSGEEKPLTKVAGVPLVARVYEALKAANAFDEIVAAVSPRTAGTRRLLQSAGARVVETAGSGYSEDLSELLRIIGPGRLLVVPADLPLLDAKTVLDIISARQSKPLLSVVFTSEFAGRKGITPSFLFWRGGRSYCRTGISVFDVPVSGCEFYDEEILVMDRMQVAVNVNTKEERGLAERLLVQHADDFAKN